MNPNARHRIRTLLFFVAIALFIAGLSACKTMEPKKTQSDTATVESDSSQADTGIQEDDLPPPESTAPPPQNLLHEVKWRGETLSIIAKWYTGSYAKWRDLAAANPHIDPNMVFLGDKIMIPENLLRTRQAMPRDFVNQQNQGTSAESPPSAASDDEAEEDLELFGPKE